MCNLYTAKVSAAEVARHFQARIPNLFNAPEETLPGYPGMVVREGEGGRIVQSMVWGFPLLTAGMKARGSKPKAVNQVADLAKPIWRELATKPQWRCIIPLTGFCEAEGEKGSKTRTWFSVREQAIFAWAGFWRNSAEWGAVYSGLMTDCNETVRPVHSRMPVLLHPEDYGTWLRGSLDEVLAFQGRCFPDDLIAMDRTQEHWLKRKAAAAGAADLLTQI